MKVRITNEPLVKVDRLGRAIASEEMRDKMDVLIADELIERGVSKLDIMLGFVPKKLRSYEGFATV